MSQQYHDTPKDQLKTHSVVTNVLVLQHSFQRSTVVHHEGSVTTDLEDIRLEEKVETMKIRSRQSQFNLKGKIMCLQGLSRPSLPILCLQGLS